MNSLSSSSAITQAFSTGIAMVKLYYRDMHKTIALNIYTFLITQIEIKKLLSSEDLFYYIYNSSEVTMEVIGLLYDSGITDLNPKEN